MKKSAVLASIASLLLLTGCQPTATPDSNAAPESTSVNTTVEEKTDAIPEPVAPTDVEIVEETVVVEEAAPEAPAVEEAAPEVPAVEEAAPEAPAVEEAAPEVPAVEEAAPEAPAVEEAAPESEATSTSAAGEAVSAYAPADALMTQVKEYLEDIEKNLADEATYADKKDVVSEDAAGLAVFYLALGLNDQPNECKAKAANLIKAAQSIADAADYAAAKAGFEALKSAAAAAPVTQWVKVAKLSSLMKQVPAIDTKMKRSIPKRMEKKQDECLAMCAAVAALMQGSIANADETEKPAESTQWKAFSIQGRNAAAAVAAAVTAKDKDAATEAMDALHKSCDDCHAVFHQAALGK